jgi:hypothetical protein
LGYTHDAMPDIGAYEHWTPSMWFYLLPVLKNR